MPIRDDDKPLPLQYEAPQQKAFTPAEKAELRRTMRQLLFAAAVGVTLGVAGNGLAHRDVDETAWAMGIAGFVAALAWPFPRR